MTRTTALFLAGVFTLALTGHAMAEPISIAIGGWLFTNTALSAAFGLNTLIAATQLALTVGATIGASLLSRPRGGGQIDPGQYKSTFESSQSSEINAIGRARISGLKAFGNTAGLNRYRMVLHSATPLLAIEEYFLGGRPVTVEADGEVSSPPYAKPGGSWIYWWTKSGEENASAWSDLMIAFSSLWTAAHKAEGIAQSLIRYTSPGITTEKFGKLYQGGEPNGEVLGRWCRLYDPRVPGADPNNEATWVWSMNGPLCAAYIMLTYPNVAIGDFDWDFIAGEADRADALVATLTGSEPRSQCSGIWQSEDKRGDTMGQVLESIGCEILMSDAGLIRIRLIDDAPAAEIAFTAKHIIDWSWKSGPDAAERPNVCRISYYSPERNYEMADIDLTGIAWARIDDEVTRYGEKIMDIQLPFCPSASQAQRIGRRLFLSERADTGVALTNMAGMAAWGRKYASIELDTLEESPLAKIAPPRCNDENGTVEIPFTVWPDELATPWNPATMEAPAPDQIPSLEYQAELTTPAAPFDATIVQYGDGSYEVRTGMANVAGATIAELVYRSYTGGLPNAFAGMTEFKNVNDVWIGYAAANLLGQQADFKGRVFNDEDEGSHFSPVLSVNPLSIRNTPPAAPTLDVADRQTGDGKEYTATATAVSLHTARLAIFADGALVAEGPGRMGQPLQWQGLGPNDETMLITAVAYSSNGTPSA